MKVGSAGSNGGDVPLEATRVVRRDAVRPFMLLDFGELWRHRELLRLFVWRNTAIRYKQSVVGIGWALIRPITSMVVFSVIFGRLAKLPSDDVPYPIYTYVALLPWNYFAGSLGSTSWSLVKHAGVATKVYFPRLVLPLSECVTGLVDFCLAFVVLLGMMVWYHSSIQVTWGIVLLPAFMLLAMAGALAVGLWLSVIMVRYRDVAHVLPFLTQIWMYVTPVAYASSLVPARWRLLYSVNPMVGVIDGFRWALLGKVAPYWPGVALGAGITIVLLVTGLYYFDRGVRTYADVV